MDSDAAIGDAGRGADVNPFIGEATAVPRQHFPPWSGVFDGVTHLDEEHDVHGFAADGDIEFLAEVRGRAFALPPSPAAVWRPHSPVANVTAEWLAGDAARCDEFWRRRRQSVERDAGSAARDAVADGVTVRTAASLTCSDDESGVELEAPPHLAPCSDADAAAGCEAGWGSADHGGAASTPMSRSRCGVRVQWHDATPVRALPACSRAAVTGGEAAASPASAVPATAERAQAPWSAPPPDLFTATPLQSPFSALPQALLPPASDSGRMRVDVGLAIDLVEKPAAAGSAAAAWPHPPIGRPPLSTQPHPATTWRRRWAAGGTGDVASAARSGASQRFAGSAASDGGSSWPARRGEAMAVDDASPIVSAVGSAARGAATPGIALHAGAESAVAGAAIAAPTAIPSALQGVARSLSFQCDSPRDGAAPSSAGDSDGDEAMVGAASAPSALHCGASACADEGDAIGGVATAAAAESMTHAVPEAVEWGAGGNSAPPYTSHNLADSAWPSLGRPMYGGHHLSPLHAVRHAATAAGVRRCDAAWDYARWACSTASNSPGREASHAAYDTRASAPHRIAGDSWPAAAAAAATTWSSRESVPPHESVRRVAMVMDSWGRRPHSTEAWGGSGPEAITPDAPAWGPPHGTVPMAPGESAYAGPRSMMMVDSAPLRGSGAYFAGGQASAAARSSWHQSRLAVAALHVSAMAGISPAAGPSAAACDTPHAPAARGSATAHGGVAGGYPMHGLFSSPQAHARPL